MRLRVCLYPLPCAIRWTWALWLPFSPANKWRRHMDMEPVYGNSFALPVPPALARLLKWCGKIKGNNRARQKESKLWNSLRSTSPWIITTYILENLRLPRALQCRSKWTEFKHTRKKLKLKKWLTSIMFRFRLHENAIVLTPQMESCEEKGKRNWRENTFANRPWTYCKHYRVNICCNKGAKL